MTMKKKMRTRTAKRKLELVSLDQVAHERVTWLWEPYLPRGELAILDGDPGVGKTYLACAIAAAVTTGSPLPGRTKKRRSQDVVYLTAEDSIAQSLRGRLEACGAHLARVHTVKTELQLDERTVRRLERDVLKPVAPALVVLDPLESFLGVDVRGSRVRRVLDRLVRAVKANRCAVLGIRHLTKGTNRRITSRGVGSLAIFAAARSALLAGIDPDTGEAALVHTKSSFGPRGSTLGYEVRDAFRWIGPSSLTEADLLAQPTKRQAEALRDAKEFLAENLIEAMPADDLISQAKAAGISTRTLRRAKRELEISSKKNGAGWIWLPRS